MSAVFADRIPPSSDTDSRLGSSPSDDDRRYPVEFRPWTGRPDAFKKLRGKIPSGYTKDILEYLYELMLMCWRRGETFEQIPADQWSDKWKKGCTYRLATPPVRPEEIAQKLGCSLRTAQNSLSEAFEIGATARRKVGKRYAYTLLFNEFDKIPKQDEPKARRGPVSLPKLSEPTDEPRGIRKIPQRCEIVPVPDQASQYRFEFETIAGEPTRIRVIPISGEEQANKSTQEVIQVRAENCANGCSIDDSTGPKGETEAKPQFQPLMPTDQQEAKQLYDAVASLRARSKGPLCYTTVAHPDYVSVSIFPRSQQQKGVMATDPRATQQKPIQKAKHTGLPVGVAASNPRHEAILAAIPIIVRRKLGLPGPVLLAQIETNLRNAPLEMLTERIKSRWDHSDRTFTSMGLVANLAKEVSETWEQTKDAPVERSRTEIARDLLKRAFAKGAKFK